MNDQCNEETKQKLMEAELSTEELEVIQGGRNYLNEGCAATVEYESFCNTNDACRAIWVTYENKPSKYKCPDCKVYIAHETVHSFRCPKCRSGFSDINGYLLQNWPRRRVPTD